MTAAPEFLWGTDSPYPLAALVWVGNRSLSERLMAKLHSSGAETIVVRTLSQARSLFERKKIDGVFTDAAPHVQRALGEILERSQSVYGTTVTGFEHAGDPPAALDAALQDAMRGMVQSRLRYHRVPAAGDALCLWRGSSTQGRILNLSTGGLLLEAAALQPPQRHGVSLLLSLNNQAAITVDGVVVRAESDSGIAVRFCKVEDAHAKKLLRFVQKEMERRYQRFDLPV